MRVLTVRQPWAWAIIRGGKDVENRSRNLAGGYRGPVLIHAAAKKPDDRAYIEAALASEHFDPTVLREKHSIRDFGVVHPLLVGQLGSLFGAPVYQGAVIGVVDLVDVHWSGMECSRADIPCHEYALCSPWAMAYHHHLMLADPRPLATPIPATGKLGLWRPDAELLAALAEQGVDQPPFHADVLEVTNGGAS